MNKEVPLKERIEKLYESGYVNEFNYLENQLQEARYLVAILHKQIEEKDKEIERLRKREKKWEKWTTEKEILSTKMSEYLCKWKNIKREYKNQVESNRLKKQKIERLNNIIDELETTLEREIKYGKELVIEKPDDKEIRIAKDTLEKVLEHLKELKEGK